MPLTGYRIVDLTRIISGPFCSMLLADLGAEVVKIESPTDGDPLRAQGAMVEGFSWYFASYNRNKRSLTLDLRTPEGRGILERLIARSDALVENYRPGVLDKMGLSEARLRELNPGLIVGSISGFGRDGPYAERPAFDFIAQAMSGFMSTNGAADGPPLRTGIPLSDLIAGLYCALGVVGALLARERGGMGQQVSTSLVDGLVSFLSYMASNTLASGRPPERSGNDHPLVAPYGLFAASDGPIAIAPSNDSVYRKLLKALDLTRLEADERFRDNAARMRNREPLRAEIEAVTRTRSQAHWIERLNAGGVPCGPVLDLPDVFHDPQILHQEMVIEANHPAHGPVRMTGFPLKLSGTPCRLRRPPPDLGGDTDEILADLGFDAAQREGLRARGVV